MSGPSKVIVLDPDPRAGRLVQLGLEREGIGFVLADPASVEIPPEAGAILVGGGNGAAVDLIKRAKTALQTANIDIPIIAASRGTARAELEAAGADEVLSAPTFLRDVVTVCRILHGVPAQKRDHLVGNLAETTGSYTLVRALAALGRSGVLTMIRGLRRGEVRFYKGEVTSAELGVIHGQAAFHQLLLWTDARFDFAHHEIVRRQQIPLSPEELFADAERFLEGVRDAAGGLSPATVLEQDLQRITDLGKHIPTEVFGVLRMFDGHRVLADILEDSPYRVFETLRVAQKAVEVGLLRSVESQRPKATWRAVLAIDEWLVGNETRDAVVERTADLDTGSHPVQKPPKSRSKKSRHKRTSSPMPTPKTEIDWGALVPRVIGAEVGPLSGVVPAQAAHGEVEAPTRDRAREKLEALMDTDKRDRIFPTEIGLEPKVVIAGMDAEPTAKPVTPDEADTVKGSKRKQKKAEKAAAEEAAKDKIAAEMARIEAERAVTEAARLEAERIAAQKAAAELAAVDAEKAAAAERIAKEKIAAEMARIEAERVAVAEQAAKDKIAAEMARIEAERAANERAAAEAKRAAEEQAAADKAQAERELAESQARVHENVERMRIERLARDEADTKAAAEAAITANTNAVEDAKAYAARVKAAAEARRKEAAVVEAAHASSKDTASDARELVRQLVADAVPPAEPTFLATPPADTPTPTDIAASNLIATPNTADTDRDIAIPMTGDTLRGVIPAAISGATTVPVRSDDAVTKPFVRAEATSDPFVRITDPVTVAEAGQTNVAVSDVVTVNRTSDTAMVTASPRVLISETPAQAAVASVTPAVAISSTIERNDATPEATDDEPSDGVILAPIATADTARVAARARAMRPPEPAHDGPPVKETTGEIGDRRVRTGIQEKIELEPSILVNDLAAAHTAIAAAVAKTATTPAPGDASSSSKELDVATVRRDAVAFSDDEEAFFKRAEGGTAQVPKLESFDDLDEGYEPTSFWGKVFGNKKKPPPPR